MFTASYINPQQYKEAKLFWDALARKTNSLVLVNFAVYTEGNVILKWIQLNDKKPLHPSNVFDLLVNEKAFYKNAKRNMSVLWQFAKDQTYNIIIIDDIQNIEKVKNGGVFLIWQTSKEKYQAAFLLDRYVDAEDAKKIQKSLIELYGGDKACIGASHNVKAPGFFNTKYLNNPPYIQVVHRGRRVLPADELLRYYNFVIKQKELAVKNNKKSFSCNLSEKKKDWWYFYNIKQDKSAADFSYALYLMHFGYTDEEIKQILLNKSDDIENRKRGHLDDYLDRTVRKARDFFKPFKSEEEN
jgi:hypothetical protein